MKPVAYTIVYDNKKKIPTPLYTVYENGRKVVEDLTLAEGLQRYPESTYRWFER